jgi:hypothetical protein
VGPDPIAITSSDPAAVLPALGKLELDSVGALNFGNTSAPYVYYKVTGTTTFYGAFNTPGPQTVTVVDQANPSATATIDLNVVAFPPPAITTAPLSQTVAIGAAGSLWVAASGGTPLAYQWNFNGSPIAGATNSVLTLPSVTAASAGSYTVTVTNAVGSVTSPAAVLTTSGSGTPLHIVLQPRPVLVNGHSSVVFTVLAGPPSLSVGALGGTGALQTRVAEATTYQWFFNDMAIPGATSASLGLGAVTAADSGDYTCLVSNGSGSVMTDPAALEVVADHASRLTNFSCRADVGSGSAVAIVGFVVSGQPGMGTRNFLVRASGPALSQFGLTGLLPDPLLRLDNTYGPYDSNAGWGGSPLLTSVSSSLGAFAWPSGTSKDAALFETLPPGAYTAEISGASGDGGIALGEVYDANPAYNPRSALMNLANISMRGQVGTGGNIMIAGFTITGTTAKTVLIRASGPALTPFGVTGVLPDPSLRVLSGSTVLAADTGWGGDPLLMSAATSVGAFSWGASGTPDSAVLVTLPPGDYTAEVSGSSGDTGVALIEVYALP